MHDYEYIDSPDRLLTPEIVNLLSAIHEYKGRQELYIVAQPDVLTALLNIARIQSTKASNKIEGIFTSDERLEALVMEKAEPRNRSEEEIAGYREVLTTVHENYEYISVNPDTILQLHRDLYSYSGNERGGRFKNADNVIAESGKDGTQKVRFVPVPAFQTTEAIEHLCERFRTAMESGRHDALLLVPMFVLDFLCIHPFNDGNGRMSRLLTLLLLYRSGYIVGKYISVEMLIEQSKETYYEALRDSSQGWHSNENNYAPFVRYYLGILLKAYKEFQERVKHLQYRRLSKPDRIKAVFARTAGKLTKADLAAYCPDISETTIERTLKELLDAGYIGKVGKARATGYVRKPDSTGM